MDMDFATSCPLVRPALPRIRFLFVGSRLCSTLPSDGPSRFRPCALLVLHLHQVAQGTFTPKLSDMSDIQDAARRLRQCRRLRGGILDCRCARRSASRQVGTKGWSFPIEQRDAAIDLNIRQRPLYMTNLLNLTHTTSRGKLREVARECQLPRARQEMLDLAERFERRATARDRRAASAGSGQTDSG